MFNYIISYMKMSLNELRAIIRDVLLKEFNTPSGGLRKVRQGGRQQFKIGKVEDENRELSSIEANELFPGSVDAWIEIVPELWSDAPIMMDPISIRKGTLFFKEGNKLTAAFQDVPQIQLATWDEAKQDWIENDFTNQDF
jgi:hypothetical protein